ncbi:Hydroxyethylthiazole kinase [Capsicum annuum]|uniref:hydroxyethylthiazole kinase n=1 Tax=Capsicum annuum TaxID=4072 RepID=A0A2G2ZJP3_CAPAN|nr:Hydroxyethylthiazole kinase [Capsicum annuum]
MEEDKITNTIELQDPLDYPKQAWTHFQLVHQKSPLIQCITNFVSMDFMANTLLSAGASPAMIHSVDEIPEFTPKALGVCINVGTLTPDWLPGIKLAAQVANQFKKPWVLDPVAAGGSSFRLKACLELLGLKPSVVRGNASEILALFKGCVDSTSKLVDEMPEFTPKALGVCINAGTLAPDWLPGMKLAAQVANQLKKPWVLDPVAAGGSSFRLKACLKLLGLKPSVVRGNGSEILALFNGCVDSNSKLAAQVANQFKKPWVLDPVAAGGSGFRLKARLELLGLKPSVVRGTASEILALFKGCVESTSKLAAQVANQFKKPWVLDPVAAGGSGFRLNACLELLGLNPSVVRGNGSEILALFNGCVDSIDEMPEFTPKAHVVCINVGTLTPDWLPSMKLAAQVANQLKKPWVLDPVDGGGSSFRKGVFGVTWFEAMVLRFLLFLTVVLIQIPR